MSVEFKMPDPGEGIHEAEILEINVSEGDRVEEGQAVMQVETDKASVEIPAPVTGRVEEIRVKVGDMVAVGDVLIVFTEEDADQNRQAAEEDVESEEKKNAQADKEQETPVAEDEKAAEADKESEDKSQDRERHEKRPDPETKGEKEAEAGEESDKEAERKPEDRRAGKEGEKRPRSEGKPGQPEGRQPHKKPVPATPATRRLARELHVDLEQVKPGGPGGRVTAEDVEAHAKGKEKAKMASAEEEPSDEKTTGEKAAAKRPEAKGDGLPDFSQWGEIERTPLRSIRRATAKRMALSWSRVPQVTHEDLADITDLEQLRRENKDEVGQQGGALTITVFAMKAAMAALKAFPRFNASLDADAGEIILKKYFHIGIAVDTERGLLVPVVRNADCKSMVELAREVYELAERTRQGEVQPADMSGGTFTITNIGSLGGTGFTPIINYPQVAILGLATARLQPVIRGSSDDFEVAARLMLPLCLGFDHRIVDGADAARFLGEVIRLLENPEQLLFSA